METRFTKKVGGEGQFDEKLFFGKVGLPCTSRKTYKYGWFLVFFLCPPLLSPTPLSEERGYKKLGKTEEGRRGVNVF